MAYHEAGHAVVAWACGDTVELVSLLSSPPKTSRRGDETNAEIALIVAHGGMQSEERLTANPEPSEGAAGDLDKIEWILRDHLPKGVTREVFKARAMSQAKTFISRHWNLVEAVASALMRDRELSEGRFADIVKDESS